MVDPGTHALEVVDGDRFRQRSVTAAPGQTLDVGFDLAGAPQAGAVGPGAGADERDRGSAQRTVAWGALGLGALGIVVGTATGVIALSKKGDLEDGCRDGNCPRALWADNDTYDSMKTVSVVGFVGGAVGLAAGVLLLWIAPTPKGQAQRGSPRSSARATFAGAF